MSFKKCSHESIESYLLCISEFNDEKKNKFWNK